MHMTGTAFRAVFTALALSACGGSGQGPGPGPVGTAIIEGTVRNAGTDDPLPGVEVSAGEAEATTDAGGRFRLTGVPTGSVTVGAQANGFETYSETIAVQEGSNTHEIRLSRRSLFQPQDFAIYVPPDVPAVRGVIHFSQAVGGHDTRDIAIGTFNDPDPTINDSRRQLRPGVLGLAAKYGLAIMGSATLQDGPATYMRVLGALTQVAGESGRPELAHAPLFPVGISAGGAPAYGFTLWRPSRTIGFALVIPVPPLRVRSAEAQQVPGLVQLAELDQAVGTTAQTMFFEENRAEGALWALAVERGAGHTALSVEARTMLLQWMDVVLGRRLPAEPPSGAAVVLPALDEASGWLGDRTSYEIAAYADYVGDKRQASWLPSMAAAQVWKAFVSVGSGPVEP